MHIGIIGSGRVGGTVGKLWARAGHMVLFSSRRPERLAALIKEAGNGARAGTVAEAAAFGEVVLFAPPFDATDEVLSEIGAGGGALDGKILIDATNPYQQDLGGLTLPATTTAAEELQRKVPRARLVKAYNTLPAAVLADGAHRPAGQQYVLFYSGAEAAAKTIVAGLIADSGFAPVNAGALSDAYHQEPRGPLYGKRLTIEEAHALLRTLGIMTAGL